MKTILSLVFAFIAIGQVNANGTKPHSPVGMSVLKNGSLVKVFYRGEQSGKVKVTIYNEEGAVVFTEVMRDKEHFMRPYNFSSLPEGEYSIEVMDEQGKRVRKITHAKKKKVNKRTAVLIQVPDQADKFMLAIPNQGRDAFTVRIYNEQRRLVYKNTEIANGDFAAVYNLSRLEGDHHFEIFDQKGSIVPLRN